ncbi:MAG: hypothetical protein ACFE9Z_16915 [Promethearchaeota archaeon]
MVNRPILIETKEKKEICNRCKKTLENKDYIYRRTMPNVITYICSKCGYFKSYVEE